MVVLVVTGGAVATIVVVVVIVAGGGMGYYPHPTRRPKEPNTRALHNSLAHSLTAKNGNTWVER